MKKLLLTTVLLAVSTQSFAVQFAFREPMHGVKANAESPAYAPSENPSDSAGNNGNIANPITDTDTDTGVSSDNDKDSEQIEDKEDEHKNNWYTFAEENGLPEPNPSVLMWANAGITSLPTDPYPFNSIDIVDLSGNDITNINSLSNVTHIEQIWLTGNSRFVNFSGFNNITNDVYLSSDFYSRKDQIKASNGYVPISNSHICNESEHDYDDYAMTGPVDFCDKFNASWTNPY